MNKPIQTGLHHYKWGHVLITKSVFKHLTLLRQHHHHQHACMARFERVARRALKRRCLDTDFELNQTTKLSEERGETWQQGTVTTTTAEESLSNSINTV